MTSSAVQILRENVGLFVDRLVARLMNELPTYARLEGEEVRASIRGFATDTLIAVETGDSSALIQRLKENSTDRVSQGFSLSDYLKAMFMAPPVCRELVRELGPRNDPSLAVGLAELETRMNALTAMAANLFTERTALQLTSKNRELNRLNQELQTREKVLSAAGDKTNRALASANEFNARVLESLASGIAVMTATD